MWIVLIITWFICAGFSAYIANQKNRSSSNWFLLGLFFGIFALIAIAVVPILQNQISKSNSNFGRAGLQYWVCNKCGQMNGFAISICSKCGARHLN